MPLSEFMPYGAPELIDGASPRLARSTLMASGLVALMVWGLGVLAAQHGGLREVPVVDFPPYTFDPKVYVPKDPAAAENLVPKLPRIANPDGEFRPVVEAPVIEPTIEDPGPIGAVGEVHPGESGQVGAIVGPLPPLEPDVNAYVYTDELPQLVKSVKPIYPDFAREAGIEGTVKLKLLVGLDGRVRRAVVRPGGSVPALDQAAIDAALATVFTPALANKHPVMVWVTQDYRFKLH